MSEETKTYVFGNSDQASPLLAAMNNGGFGGNNAWWVIVLLAALWGGNGFGRNNNDCSQLYSTLTNGQNSILMVIIPLLVNQHKLLEFLHQNFNLLFAI